MPSERKFPVTDGNVFGIRLAALRREVLGMTNAEQLAAALDVSGTTARNWEQGRGLPDAESLFRLYHLIGPECFVELMPHIRPATSVVLPVGDDGESQATIVALRGTRPERLAHLVKVAEQIARETD